MRKIVLLIALLFIGFITYNFLTYPDFDKLENDLNSQTKLKANQLNWKETYDKDVQFDLKNKTGFITKAKLYSNKFLPPKIYTKASVQKLVNILNDSSSYKWGETTVEYNRYLIFLDSNDKIISLAKIDTENEYVQTFPFIRTIKWGGLSKKGYDEFHKVLRSN